MWIQFFESEGVINGLDKTKIRNEIDFIIAFKTKNDKDLTVTSKRNPGNDHRIERNKIILKNV